MTVCSDNHDEIVWDDARLSKCPVCLLVEENDEKENEIRGLNKDIEGKDKEIEELTNQLDDRT